MTTIPDPAAIRWRLWLRTCALELLAQGPDLIEALSHAMCNDAVARAERLLSEAETEGLIERGENQAVTHRLYRSLITFGVGGVAGGAPTVKAASPVLYGFSPRPLLLAKFRDGLV